MSITAAEADSFLEDDDGSWPGVLAGCTNMAISGFQLQGALQDSQEARKEEEPEVTEDTWLRPPMLQQVFATAVSV